MEFRSPYADPSPSESEPSASGSDSEKEEGVNGYGVFAALTVTAETECS